MNAFLDGFASLMDYFVTQWQQILSLTIEHIEMTAIAVGCSILIGVPLGILVSYVRKLGKPVIGIANVVQAIPSMALLGLAIPLLGIGTLPAVVMVIIYSLLPIVKNTYTGITNIDPLLVEAATGIGLTKWQVLYKIKLPMALPVIMAGADQHRHRRGPDDHGRLHRRWGPGISGVLRHPDGEQHPDPGRRHPRLHPGPGGGLPHGAHRKTGDPH